MRAERVAGCFSRYFRNRTLTASNRARLQTPHMTYEDLSNVLGVPRASVTQTALALRETGAIRYHQGRVTIVDRRRLSRAACECYRPQLSSG